MGNTCAPSRTPTSSFIHRWSITHFSWYLPAGRLHWKEYIKSRLIKPENSKLAFYLRLYPHGIKYRDYASLEFVCLQSGQMENVQLKLKFVIEDKRKQRKFKTIAYHNFDRNDRFVCKKFIRIGKLDKENLLPNDTLTICCSIQEYDNSNIIQGIAQTESVSEPDLLSHEWTIENFTDYLSGGKMEWKNVLKSKTFSFSSNEFYLSLNPSGNGVNSKDHLSIFLHRNSSEDCLVKFNWAFSLIDEYGTRHNLKTAKNRDLTATGLGFTKYISHADLKKFANKYLSQNKLIIGVDIDDVGNEQIVEHTETSTFTAINALTHIWTIENFSRYLTNEKTFWKNRLNSKKFSTHDGDYTFYLCLRFNGPTDEGKDHLSVCLSPKKDSDTYFNLAFSLVDENGSRHNIKKYRNQAPSTQGLDFYQFISHVNLLNPENNYLSDNKLTICVDIEDVDCKIIRGYRETHSTTKSNCHVHIWTIDNFSSLGTGLAWKIGLKSYIDSIESKGEEMFFLRLHPNGDDDSDYISLYLMSHAKKELVIDCSFAIFGNGVSTVNEFTKNVSNTSSTTATSWGYSKFISRAELFDRKNGYLKNDALTIYCGV